MLTHVGTKTITTKRLILRRFEYSDSEDMLKYWVADPKIQSMYSEPCYQTTEAVKELLTKYIAAYQNEAYYRWAIIEKEANLCIGQIAIFLVDDKNHFCEIEYCVGGQFQRKGYCSEAVQAIIDYAFKEINLHKMQVCHKENNLPSKAVIEKCGFTYEGKLRDYFYMEEQYVSRLYYSMLRSEWEVNKINA
ncbi:ribosomal-protein-alanine N-acetyltransferase [Enterococcus sp. PF1-24]|uniref:GNAT family N-acetyltransferase n=1 Tax=unclassified Enterococcus TaxID=2608891 RepID=UPI002475728B|nr:MULTISPECIES: GNAT family N-acetyltransferase [unclassified Enterococcus]MDH6365326.1 ribosomal-protein-alanine N-acetyltransferase [Enterococcus sp. PFB1-1]MDH6402418.1 ribosomal-protein-alanine N-acetyltransferase [Enterococcus sp. PF1-24]